MEIPELGRCCGVVVIAIRRITIRRSRACSCIQVPDRARGTAGTRQRDGEGLEERRGGVEEGKKRVGTRQDGGERLGWISERERERETVWVCACVRVKNRMRRA